MHVLRSHTGLQTRDWGWAWESGSECPLGHSAAQSSVRTPGCSSLSSGMGNTPTGKGGKDPEEGSAEGQLWDPTREEQEVQAVPVCQEPVEGGGRTHPLENPPAGLAASVTTGTALGAVEGWEGGAQLPQGNHWQRPPCGSPAFPAWAQEAALGRGPRSFLCLWPWTPLAVQGFRPARPLPFIGAVI